MLTLMLALAPLAGGEIFGDIRLGDAYVANVAVELVCGAETVKAKTDSAGSFRIRTTTDGKCKLTVAYKGENPSVDVVVFTRPTRYRFVLELVEKKYVLKRV